MLLHKAVCRNLLRFTEIQQKNNFSHPFKSKYLDITYRSTRNTSFKDSIRQPRIDRTPFEGFQVISNGHVPVSHIWKALMFTGAFTTGCFVVSSLWEYENARSLVIERSRMVKTPWFTNKHREITNNPWENLKKDLLVQWNKLSPGERVFVPICAVNLLVFGLWRVPSLKNKMLTYFCSNPSARVVCWPMFLSTFSHYSMFHIFANMYVLHSFSNAAVMSMGKEQFLAVYFSGGVLASLSSILYKAITKQAGFSLGASGAIMTILAYVCAQYPDTQLSIMFLPMFTFSAGAAIKVIMGLDIAGCILGWKLFDHAAHLGGALFGIFWAYKGREIWQKRLKIISLYHDWRKQK